MKILILGCDGYIGWPLRNHLENLGHEIFGIDNLSRRNRAIFNLTPEKTGPLAYGNVNNLCPSELPEKIDTIIHLAQQPSAPWSMRDFEHADKTQIENISGTLRLLWIMKDYYPDAHLVKLGSMGEYGTPNCDIPEGFLDYRCQLKTVNVNCPYDGLSFPRQPNSFYHLSKCFDSMNIEFACRIWGLKSTDIMQGVVFGLNYWDQELTRFDYDQYFGTVINRFCAQALAGIPLTVYGQGGQTRGYLPLKDSIECLTLAIENPPNKGEYRVFNQYAEIKSINELADIVKKASKDLGIDCQIQHIENPRIESESHSYETTNEKLKKLGYEPNFDFKDEVKKLIQTIEPFKNKINKSVILPTTEWK